MIIDVRIKGNEEEGFRYVSDNIPNINETMTLITKTYTVLAVDHLLEDMSHIQQTLVTIKVEERI